MKKKENERKIGIKNYLIITLIFILATAITLYLCNVYRVYEESKRQIPILRGTLYEIKSEELEHYLSENPTTMLYICTASNLTCRNYEKDLKKYVVKEELQEIIIYLNLSEEEKETFAETFNQKYSTSLKLKNNYPSLVIVEDGKITHILQNKENEKLTITKTRQFMDLHKIGDWSPFKLGGKYE